jgi:transposase
MKSRDLRELVLSKYENGDSATKIFHDLLGTISRKTSFNWCKMIRETGSIDTCTSPSRTRTIRTRKTIQKVKNRLKRKKRILSRKFARELDISRTSDSSVLIKDFRLRPTKKNIPVITDVHKVKRKKFANRTRTNFGKEDIENIVFL